MRETIAGPWCQNKCRERWTLEAEQADVTSFRAGVQGQNESDLADVDTF